MLHCHSKVAVEHQQNAVSNSLKQIQVAAHSGLVGLLLKVDDRSPTKTVFSINNLMCA